MALQREKLGLDLRKLDIGQKVLGSYVDTILADGTDMNTGAPKKFTRFVFDEINPETGVVVKGQRFAINGDRGLETEWAGAMVKAGDLVEVERLEKTTNAKGQPVNQYVIYKLSLATSAVRSA